VPRSREFVRLPVGMVRELDDEQLGMLCRALVIGWERGQLKLRNPSKGLPVELTEFDLKFVTRRGRVDHARQQLAKLPRVAFDYLGASWTLGGALAGLLTGGKCLKLHAIKARDPRKQRPEVASTPHAVPVGRGSAAPAEGRRPGPREREQAQPCLPNSRHTDQREDKHPAELGRMVHLGDVVDEELQRWNEKTEQRR
jgi:hypothetical protein